MGAPAGIVIGILGLLVGAAGAIASLFTSESELEVWADHCLYGTRYGKDTYASWKDNLAKQLEALNDALYQVRVKGDVKQGVSHLEIEPTGISKSSKMTCYINASSDLTMYPARQDLPLRDDQRDCQIEFGEGEGANYVKKIKLSIDMPFAPDVTFNHLTVILTIDPDADGTALKRTAVVKQGWMDWVWSKL